MSKGEELSTAKPESTQSAPSPVLEWKTDTAITQSWQTVLRADGESVYVTDGPGYFAAFDVQTGHLSWTYDAGLKGVSAASLVNVGDLLLIAFSAEVNVDANTTQYTAFVVAVDRRTGAEKWRFQTEGENVSAPSVVNDAVYFGTDAKAYNVYSQVPPAGYVYVLRVSTGKLLWKFPIPDAYVGETPVVMGSALYFIGNLVKTGGSALYSVNTTTHEETWNVPVCEYGRGPFVGNGIIYIDCLDSLQAISTRSGKCLWTLTVSSAEHPDTTVTSCPAITRETPEPTPIPLQPDSTPVPHLPLPTDAPGPGIGLSTPPLIVGDTLFIGAVTDFTRGYVPDGCPYAVDSYLLALDARSGKEKWRFKTVDRIRSDLASADGAIYFNTSPCFEVMGNTDDIDYVYAVDARSGSLRWRFQHSISDDGLINQAFTALNGSLYFTTEGGKLFALLTTLPGMPRSGNNKNNGWGYAGVLAALSLCVGFALKRKVPGR